MYIYFYGQLVFRLQYIIGVVIVLPYLPSTLRYLCNLHASFSAYLLIPWCCISPKLYIYTIMLYERAKEPKRKRKENKVPHIYHGGAGAYTTNPDPRAKAQQASERASDRGSVD